LDFAFVPRKPQATNLMERPRDQQVRWEQFNTFEKQYSPFTLGVLQQKDCEPDLHWENMGTGTSVNRMSKLLDSEVTYYAAWPLKAYISDFRVSNFISLSYRKELDSFSPSSWLTIPSSFDSSELAAPKFSANVILKKNSGTVSSELVDSSVSSRHVRTEEVWVNEQP